jgi:hypothetical protein
MLCPPENDSGVSRRDGWLLARERAVDWVAPAL